MLDKGLGHRCSTSMFDDPPSRTPTPEDWSELAADDDRCDDVSESSLLSGLEAGLEEEKPLEDDLLEQKAAQQYGMELQLQIEQLERTPRPPFESIRHLRERIEVENDLYRRQFVWQMENMIRFTTDAS